MSKPAISDQKVKEATGKDWAGWYKLLDQAKADKMSHTEIAKHLYDGPLKKRWWCQMVANTYEQHKGLRNKYQNKEGYQVSVSRTIAQPASTLYKQWISNKFPVTITTAKVNKLLRGKLNQGDSRIIVAFMPKGKDKTQVVVQLEKLKNQSSVKQARKYWSEILAKKLK